MTSIDQRLREINLKIKRAKEHVADLERQVRAFLESNPYKVGTKHDPQTRKLIYYVTSVEPTPDCLPLIAGDIIQNLMSGLDHLAYQLVCSDTNGHPPKPRRIYFPIFDAASEYESSKHRKIEGARQETVDAIEELKPYKGGNDLLWSLHRLNNIDKHRLLFTVGSQAGGVHIGQLFVRYIANASGHTESHSIWRDLIPLMKSWTHYFVPADSGFPLKPGFELFVGTCDEEPDPEQKFLFQVALNEPGVVEGKPLIETMHQFTTLVEGIVAALTPRLV